MARPALRARRGYVTRPLDALFSASSHVAVLRTLGDLAAGASGREIARLAGLAPQAALDALTRLEATGMIRRTLGGGAHLFTLNRGHWLVQNALLPLFESERAFTPALLKVLRGAFARHVLSGVIFGSVSRGEDAPSSDVDVCLIVRRDSDVRRVLDRAARLANEVAEDFGVRLSPIAFTRAELARRHRRGDALVRNVIEDGRLFVGESVAELARG